MKLLLAALLMVPGFCIAAPRVIEPAGIVLDVPSDRWVLLGKNTYPDAPQNVCFPRFDHKTTAGRIDAVMWSKRGSLDQALDKYITRLSESQSGESHSEIARKPFKAASGIEGIKYIFQTTRQTTCGPRSWKLVRYVFRNSKGQIVCLGGFGDIEEIDGIVISSLKAK